MRREYVVHPLPISSIKAEDRGKVCETPNQMFGIFVFWFVLGAIPFLGAAGSVHPLCVIPAVVFLSLLMFVAFRIRAGYCDRKLNEFAAAEAASCIATAHASIRSISEFSLTLKDRLNVVAQHVTNAETALATRRREMFWDEVDRAYYAIQQLVSAIRGTIALVNSHAARLAGRHHTFPSLTCAADIVDMRVVADRYANLLTAAEQDHEITQVFELRRHGQSRMPSFGMVAHAAREATDELQKLLLLAPQPKSDVV